MLPVLKACDYTGRFIMFSVITNTYIKKTKGPTLKEFFTATGKLKKGFFLTTRDVRFVAQRVTRHTLIFKFLPHTCQHVDACVTTT